jgi:simple sugar transport system permease protein
MIDFLVSWLATIPQLATPYALAALGLIVSERAGVLNLTAEGLMLVGALTGVIASLHFGGHPYLAIACAMAAAAGASLLFAALTVFLNVNQALAGLAFVFFCDGLTNLVGTRGGWTNRPIEGLPALPLGPLAAIPGLGRILFQQDLIVYALPAICLIVGYALSHTTYGLRLRAVGENPEAADAAGVDVTRTRLAAILAGSALIGMAGAYLSVGHTRLWIQGMTDGRGWIAVALTIFARWRPGAALGGALLFGGVEALVPRLAAQGYALPQHLMLTTPYVATLAVMIWLALRGSASDGAPGALGEPYGREERR